MAGSFFEQPILNSPYEEPSRHHALDEQGQPIDLAPLAGRRPSQLITPVPRPRKRRGRGQGSLDLHGNDGISDEEQEYNPTPIINEIREAVSSWRALANPTDWAVTPVTARLLTHWRNAEFEGLRPFFCQVEAVETAIWLTEVASKQKTGDRFWSHIKGANAQANPALLRLALKMATGTGKTTVMAMLIAWQALNAIRAPQGRLFAKGFLIITPGITIRDRLRVLQPHDPDSYFKTSNMVPPDMVADLQKARIVITNYHAFQLRETRTISKTGRSLLQGRGEQIQTLETVGQMIGRVAPELKGIGDIMVINDEAHHCYRERPGNEDLDTLTGDEKSAAKKENEAARLWISGIEDFKKELGGDHGQKGRKQGVRAVYDLSATPFFLRGSGYAEGTLFPWTVSDFSLMDAIESGIVKLPRVPVADNIPANDMPVYRNLWDHIGKKMPKKGRAKSGADANNPDALPDYLISALRALYGHYEKTFTAWQATGIPVPPVFIVVCNNTATSKLVHEWISGWQRPIEEGSDELQTVNPGYLELFRNFDANGNPLNRPPTLLIDSQQIESGDALDANFRKVASLEIEKFKREKAIREGAGAGGEITDSELLREVMNTVGKVGRLGEQVRCVVSVSMLTEGWDTNTVTHILGVRAFGTQLLCEQVVGRALRRYDYSLNDNNLYNVEYADILGIPFDFTAKPVVAPVRPPKKTVFIKAEKDRAEQEITFPRVIGYRIDLPEERLSASFNQDSTLVLTDDMIGPGETLLEGIVGEGHTLRIQESVNPKENRPSAITYHLTKHLLETHFRDEDGRPKQDLFPTLTRIARRWLKEGHLVCKGSTAPWMLQYKSVAGQAAQRIKNAIDQTVAGSDRLVAVLDAYNPKGSTRHVGFQTSKDIYRTHPGKCHVNAVVLDSDWEAELARVAEDHPRVLAYVKNQGLGLEVPYQDGDVPRHYIPDFILTIDDGRGAGPDNDDPLHLIVEVKGFRAENVKLKSETMRTKWVPGVNALSHYGRWAFVELGDVFEMGNRLRQLIDAAIAGRLDDGEGK